MSIYKTVLTPRIYDVSEYLSKLASVHALSILDSNSVLNSHCHDTSTCGVCGLYGPVFKENVEKLIKQGNRHVS